MKNENKITKILKEILYSYVWLAVLLLVADIITKNIIRSTMSEGDSIVLIPNFLSITYVLNRAAAFGIGTGNEVANRIIYIIVACIGFAVMIGIYIKQYKKLKPYVKCCLMLMSVGAIGNLIDRLFYGPGHYVVDWIDFNGIWQYVFNLADCGVVIGCIMLIFWLIISEIKEDKAKRQLEEKSSAPQIENQIVEEPVQKVASIEEPAQETKENE